MSLRKIAGLLIAGGLAVGMIGTGVGAQFTDSVTAQQNISVGTFGCQIIQSSDGTIATGGKSIEYNAPEILSSVAGSRDFNFTVQNTGDIAGLLVVSTTTAPAAPFTAVLPAINPVPLAGSGTALVHVAISWPELTVAGQTTSATFSVSCVDHL
jgi:hypothetical protein